MRVSVASIRPCYMLCIRAKAGTSFMKEKHFAACAFSLFPFLKTNDNFITDSHFNNDSIVNQ